VQVYRALLESNAAFFAAQMTAMDAATRNSSDMIDALTLYMNKVRQAAIQGNHGRFRRGGIKRRGVSHRQERSVGQIARKPDPSSTSISPRA
jgi:hypothetical protein